MIIANFVEFYGSNVNIKDKCLYELNPTCTHAERDARVAIFYTVAKDESWIAKPNLTVLKPGVYIVIVKEVNIAIAISFYLDNKTLFSSTF